MSTSSTSTTSAVPASHVPIIQLAELVEAMRGRRVTVVDVLSPESYARQHIPGAINLPVADIPRRAAQVFPDRNIPIVAYCGGPT
jgi:rhodanese-related sulfurtransferase